MAYPSKSQSIFIMICLPPIKLLLLLPGNMTFPTHLILTVIARQCLVLLHLLYAKEERHNTNVLQTTVLFNILHFLYHSHFFTDILGCRNFAT